MQIITQVPLLSVNQAFQQVGVGMKTQDLCFLLFLSSVAQIERKAPSRYAAKFAEIFQPLLDKISLRNRLEQRKDQGRRQLIFYSSGQPSLRRKLKDEEIFDFQASRMIKTQKKSLPGSPQVVKKNNFHILHQPIIWFY